MRRLAFLAVVGLMLALVGSDRYERAEAAGGPAENHLDLAAGRACKVYLRGDAMGAATNYVPTRGTASFETGTLKEASDAWVVLDREEVEVWIPRNVVLMIEVQKRK